VQARDLGPTWPDYVIGNICFSRGLGQAYFTYKDLLERGRYLAATSTAPAIRTLFQNPGEALVPSCTAKNLPIDERNMALLHITLHNIEGFLEEGSTPRLWHSCANCSPGLRESLQMG